MWQRHEELMDCVTILEACYNDVLNSINSFSHETTKLDFWYPANQQKLEQKQLDVRKSIFSASAATMALVDHFRRFSQKYSVEKSNETRLEIFGNSGIHEFIQGLRNYILHVKIVEANWVISRDFKKQTRDVNFYFYIDDLNKYKDWKSAAKQFLEHHGEKVDVYETFFKYLECVKKYYAWHRNAVLTEYNEQIQRHLSYENVLNGIKSETRWGFIVANLKTRQELLSTLTKYLSKEQLRLVLACEGGSLQQLDMVLSVTDTFDVFSDQLKEKFSDLLVNA
ncbi:hypothetical protein EDB74_102296 [Vibrio crassostreae]|nr:hypothetical protein EDB58_101128 [Vibrio crassostreae]TCV63947.1 hypothetical protein EDB74_102296 [Vibrio crassostreae]CAK2149394.1 conserved hypothetical protein [Vibrio crassostreae]CAK3011570.1 conserved hypothetical protein [Vibrio crassostreae]CAK3575083.1 conserved hypothetical protein [Vibrio crassostreae]